MAVCTICDQEMHDAASCVERAIPLIDGEYQPIKWGRETDEWPYRARCGDCDTLRDGVHHHGCDIEECPRCHGQLITCGCWDGYWPGDKA